MKKALIYTIFLLPIILAFRNLLNLSNPLVWGDAPFFYSENLNELFNMPFAWDIRNSNFGSPQLLTLWLYIPTFLLGLLHKLFGLNHEIIIRVIFYLPFIVSGFFGIFLLLSRYKFSNLAKTFGILIYLLNSYSLVLIDGGQIGIMVSYGLFPLVFFSFLKYLEDNSIKYFIFAVVSHFIIFNTDLRIALILVLFEIVWWIFLIDKKNIKSILRIISISLIVLGLNGYWIFPFLTGLKNESTSNSILNSANFIQLTNSFYLYQPHFPNNDFGNLSKTPIYFIFIPVFLLIGLLKKDRRITTLVFLFLFFTLLAKGSNPPFGEAYLFVINNIPLGSAFRDSSKFYIPAFLIASMLLSNSVDFIRSKLGKYKFLWLSFIYIILLVSVYPALAGNLSGVLGKEPNKKDFSEIHQLVKSQSNTFRSLWFNERPSMGFADWDHPAVSANLLFQERLFGSMIDGDYDLFGFLHDERIADWFELLGIKYIFYPPYEREKSLTKKELADRKLFENFILKIPGLKKLNLPISFPAYETENPKPKIFGQEKILFVLGGDEIYKKLFTLKNFVIEKNALVFLESCKFNPEVIFNIKSASFALLLSNDRNDLYLSFFCDDFISPLDSKTKEWSINDSEKYLNWKSQLLERGVRNYDYDFNKGLAYSTKVGEQLKFDLKIPEDQNYYLPVRFLTATQSSGLKVNFADKEKILKSKNANKLQWELQGPFNLKKGNYELTITNLGGLGSINTFGLIPQNIFDRKKSLIDEKLRNLTVYDIGQTVLLEEFLNNKLVPVNYWQINPTEYQVQIPQGAEWLVFSERFNNSWGLQDDSFSRQPLPLYSMINGYYIGDLLDGSLNKLYYSRQASVHFGLLVSMIAFSLLCFGIISHIILRGWFYGYIKKHFRNFKN